MSDHYEAGTGIPAPSGRGGVKKAEAMERAKAGVKMPVRARSGWEVYGQRHDDRLDGLWTVIKADTYAEALSVRKQWIARRALAQLGSD